MSRYIYILNKPVSRISCQNTRIDSDDIGYAAQPETNMTLFMVKPNQFTCVRGLCRVENGVDKLFMQ